LSPTLYLRLPIFLSRAVPPSLSGRHDKRSLSAWPSPVVPLGGKVTLQCHFHLPFVIFKIFKIHVIYVTELKRGLFKNNFTMSPATTAQAGSSRSSGSYSHSPVWSTRSDSLRIMVTVRRNPDSFLHGPCDVGPCGTYRFSQSLSQ
uniref:Immunoglobulin V-set domain-containing protein n=1 Tax=Equus asinus TaxID=9793 RepID=A0A9L0KD93_EQUAS